MANVLCGLAFTAVTAYTLIQGQLATRKLHRLCWFVGTGGSAGLFVYWALTVVFRAPKFREGIGCGGVQFVHDEL
ncbi:MAG: hypothetical protein SGPRY_007868 [Prymnesium sp.]